MEKTGRDVAEHVAQVAPAVRRRDAQTLIELMREIAGRDPEMWSSGIIGFGRWRYSYPTGTEGDSPILAFAARKPASTLYLLEEIDPQTLEALGPHKRSKGCLYLGDLDKVDLGVLRGILEASYAHVLSGGDGYAAFTVID